MYFLNLLQNNIYLANNEFSTKVELFLNLAQIYKYVCYFNIIYVADFRKYLCISLTTCHKDHVCFFLSPVQSSPLN